MHNDIKGTFSRKRTEARIAGHYNRTIDMEIREIMLRCSFLSRECIADIQRSARPFSFDRGETVVRQGEPCNDIIFISDGILRIALDKNNREDTVCFGGEGDVFMSFHTYYAGEPSTFKLVSLQGGSGYRLDIDIYRHLEQRWPELTAWMKNMLIEQFYSFEGLYSNFSLATPGQRLDSFWETTPEALRAISPADLSKTVALKYIAQYLGIAQQTLSRLRRKLVRK